MPFSKENTKGEKIYHNSQTNMKWKKLIVNKENCTVYDGETHISLNLKLKELHFEDCSKILFSKNISFSMRQMEKIPETKTFYNDIF